MVALRDREEDAAFGFMLFHSFSDGTDRVACGELDNRLAFVDEPASADLGGGPIGAFTVQVDIGGDELRCRVDGAIDLDLRFQITNRAAALVSPSHLVFGIGGESSTEAPVSAVFSNP